MNAADERLADLERRVRALQERVNQHAQIIERAVDLLASLTAKVNRLVDKLEGRP